VDLHDLGEKAIVQSVVLPIFAESGEAACIGDDAALIEIDKSTAIAVSTDRMPEEPIAKTLGLMNESDLGRYLIVSNLSDIAAMGASPIALLTNLVFPNDFQLDDFKEFLYGISSAATEYDVPVVGGDTKSGSARSCSAVAIGVLPRGEGLKRSTAEIGDSIFVTGTPCGFSTALCYNLIKNKEQSIHSEQTINELNKFFISQVPRIKEGIELRKSKIITACQDISDGVGQTIYEIANSSNLGAIIDLPKLTNAAPIITKEVSSLSGISMPQILLGPSADFELIFCTNNKYEEAVYKIFSKLGTQVNKIGEITQKQEFIFREFDGTLHPYKDMGWQSFNKKKDKSIFKKLYGGNI